jgi:YHS domain-containing protein
MIATTTRLPTADADSDLEINVEFDPVCGTAVEPESAAARQLVTQFEGRAYLFCGHGCRARFEHQPKRYAASGRSEP